MPQTRRWRKSAHRKGCSTPWAPTSRKCAALSHCDGATTVSGHVLILGKASSPSSECDQEILIVFRADSRLWCRRGTYLDEEDVRKTDKKSFDGRTYYQYEAYAPYGSLGPHTLSSVTVKARLLDELQRRNSVHHLRSPGLLRQHADRCSHRVAG